MIQDRVFYFQSADGADKEAWIGALENAKTRLTEDKNTEDEDNRLEK